VSLQVQTSDHRPRVTQHATNLTIHAISDVRLPSTNDGQEKGVASEGVIAYCVQTRNPTVQVREATRSRSISR
jgi:hypothetical protein